MASQRAERRNYWTEILNRQAASGLSVAAFCRRESISQPSFYAWRRKLAQGGPDAVQRRPSNQPDETDSTGNPEAQRFVPVRIEEVSPPAALTICLPQGIRIEVPRGVDPPTLVSILAALAEARPC